MQSEAIKSEEIDNHASIPAKEIETLTYSFNTSSINVESWSELLKSEVIKEKSILEPWSCNK